MATLPFGNTSFAQGEVREFGPVTIPVGATQGILRAQDQGWAHTGGVALKIEAYLSQDAGATWSVVALGTWNDEATAAFGPFAANEHALICSLRDDGIGQRRIKMIVTAFKALTISGSVSAN